MGFINLFKGQGWSGTSSTNNTVSNSTRTVRAVPYKNITFPTTVDTEKTRALYHNSLSGYKLAAGLCFNPVAIPLYFMGVPSFTVDNEAYSEYKEIIEKILAQYTNKLYKMTHRDGKMGVWPRWNDDKKEVEIELIDPDTIQNIMTDPDTGAIQQMYTEQNFTMYDEKGQTQYTIRKRYFTKNEILSIWDGYVPTGYERIERNKNVLGELPFIFLNNTDLGEVEGHSDYERIMPYLKTMHDVLLKANEILANMNPKLVQSSFGADAWLDKNGYDDIKEIDPAGIDMIINMINENGTSETTKFEIPTMATQEHRDMVKLLFKYIVESSGIPEIAWGLKTEGNHASAEEQMGLLFQYVKNKQEQNNFTLTSFVRSILNLIGMVNGLGDPGEVKVTWNELDAVSDETRSTIFKNYSEGITKLLSLNAIGYKEIYDYMLDKIGVDKPDTFEIFQQSVKDTGSMLSYLEMSYENQRMLNA